MERKIPASADSAHKRRLEGRETSFRKAKDRQELFSRTSGAYAIGTDENGLCKETRTLKSFHIILDRWYARMGFKKEDSEKIQSNPWTEVEAILKKGDVPRKLVRFDTHILPAVRTLKHVRKSYEDELAETDSLLRVLDFANLRLAEIKSRHPNEVVQEAIVTLGNADSMLEGKEVAVKKIVARARIKKTIEMLEEAKAMPHGSKRDVLVARACAVFTSVRERLGTWRQKSVAEMLEFNLQKECALRPERDKWLFSQLSRFAEETRAVYDYCVCDVEKTAVLDQIRAMLRGKEPRDAILAFITEKHALFRVGNRKREGAEKWIAMAEAGLQPKIGVNVDYLIGHYALLYRHVLRGQNAAALRKLGFLELFVDANKPRFILEQLRQEPDPYLAQVIAVLEKALLAFESKDFEPARGHFAEARDRMRKIAYPGSR